VTAAAVAGGALAGRLAGYDFSFLAASAIPIAAGVVGARSNGVRDGAIAGLWTGLVGSASLFLGTLIASLAADYPDAVSAGLAVSDDLGGLIVMLGPLPVAAAAIAAAAAAIVGESLSPRTPSDRATEGRDGA